MRLVSSLLSQAIFEIISMFKRWLIVGDRNVLTPPIKLKNMGEVVVAQLVERSLSIPEVRGSTPVIGKILLTICLLSTVLKRRK